MADLATQRFGPGPPTRPPGRNPTSALFWRLFLVNAAVFIVAGGALIVSPATVSEPVSLQEVSILATGSAVMLAINATLLRASLRPLDGLTALMKRVDLLQPGERVTVEGSDDVARVIQTFNDMLDRLETERGTSSARALAALEGERRRIARELHDEIGQSLTAVLLGLKRSVDRAPPALADELTAAQELVRSSLDEVRQVASRLRPGVLDDLGLLAAVAELTTDFTSATGVPVTTRIEPEIAHLDRQTELVLYRIAQESLTNIARHARAQHVEVVLADDRDAITLTIADDGHGIGVYPDGGGIRGMRERAMLVNARLEIGSASVGGCVVRLVIPTAGSLKESRDHR